jgi:2-O-methyltransferase
MSAAVNTYSFLKNAKGVIHIGASYGQERDLYAGLGLPVIWIEALPDVFTQLQRTLNGSYPQQRALNYLVTDQDDEDRNFYITSNDGMSSSIYQMKDHRLVWPSITQVAVESLKTKTLASIVKDEGIDLSQYDALILDVQGAELKVLEGAASILGAFRWILAEAADFEIYEGCALDHQLDEFFFARGYQRSATWETAESTTKRGIFDILYETVRTQKNTRVVDPETRAETWAKVGVLTSVPRLGFQIHDSVMHRAFGAKGWPIVKVGGAFWEQAMQNGMNQLIDMGCDWVITVDYDSIFAPADVAELLIMAARYPEADAVAAWQAKRHGDDKLLMAFKSPDGKFYPHIPPEKLQGEVCEVDYTVFGLTLIKVEALKKIPKPWFASKPNADGEWMDGKTDADGYFFTKWRDAGNTIYAANNAKIGHLAEMILWVDNDFNVVHQPLKEFYKVGRPF